MKHFVPNAIFVGFTGTPLLKTDKQTSLEIFGEYIHTYKFNEAVEDEVVLDLLYEARDIEQKISSPDKIDEWFDLKTRGLTDLAKAELKQKWGNIKKIYSSKSRLEKIVMDIMLDMEKRPRLMNNTGNAMLVSDSIYNACRYYELFQNAGLKECAIITSFIPTHTDIKGETTGEGYTERIIRFEIYRKMLSDYFNLPPDEALKKVEQFEIEIKDKFIKEPGQMKLLIVVNKLLTGFDAPSATYLYIDKNLHDHGLFQAVCRVNRLDDEEKDYGYIIDYKDLFKSLEQAYHDYTSGAFHGYDKKDIDGLLKNRLHKGKERLDEALEAIKALLEPVEPPKEALQYIRYFCGNTDFPDDLKEKEPRRVALYKHTIAVLRAYANIADEMPDAGYSIKQTEKIKTDIKDFENIRSIVQKAANEYYDFKQYEPAMRQLIDNFISAEDSRVLADFKEIGLVELLASEPEFPYDKIPEQLKKNPEAMAETIEHNLRKVIIEGTPANPAYFEKMSVLLDELIRQRKEATIEYEKYLQELMELAGKVKMPESKANYPEKVNTAPLRALYDNLGQDEKLARDIDHLIMTTKKDGWKGHPQKRKAVELAIKKALRKNGIEDKEELARVFELVKKQEAY